MKKLKKIDAVPSNCKAKKVKNLMAPTSWILEGDEIDKLMDECENQGYIAMDYEKSEMRRFINLRNTYELRCKNEGRVYIEVFVKEDRAFALFDCITTLNNELPFTKWMILEKELENYYSQFDFVNKANLNLPSNMAPFTHIYHKTNYFISSKQIVFSFFLESSEIFEFVRKSMV